MDSDRPTEIRYEVADGTATITLDRPERMNAFTPTMAGEIVAALDRADADDAVRVVVLTGAGRAFCAGADLQMRGGEASSPGEASHRALTDHYNPVIAALLRLPVPVVTAVNGPAAGIGCSLALAGDMVLAGESAYFLQAFVNIGLVPDGGSTWLLTRAIGRARATRMMMLGERIGAAQAEQWGLIHRAVTDAALAEEALALATRLAAGPTVALATIRRNILTALDGSIDDVLRAEAEGQRVAADSADAREGAMSFIEKRAPAFRGE